jgi:MGT family glycosyltransferase
MSKIVFLNFPTHGCINPLLATAAELVNRGEHVIYYCTEEFRDKIMQTGAEFRLFKGMINKFKIENFDLFKPLKLNIEMTIDKLDNNLEAIRKEDPDYIIHDSLCTWGKYIAAILEVPAVNLMHSFPMTKSSISFSRETASLLLKIGLFGLMNRFKKNSPKKILKKKYGINLSNGDILINMEKLNIIYTSKPMEPNIHRSEKTYKFVGPSLFFKKEQNDFPFEKLKGRNVIYISLGTLLSKNLSFYRKCINTFLNTDYIIVISTGFDLDLKEFADLPGNFIIRKSVPQQILLEHVGLFITHAGMNSVNEAICKGVPMLLFPHQVEQQMIAQRVSELGMGIVMNMRRITSEKLFENAKKFLTNSEYKTQALKYKTIFSDDEKTSSQKAVDEIFHYIKDRGNNYYIL